MQSGELPPNKAPTGLQRLLDATRYSISGLRASWQREAAFRQEVVVTALLLPVALFASISALELALLIATLLGVLIVELLNTAIEAAVDLTSPDHHPLAGIAKDAGTAAVFLSLLLTGMVWTSVLWPRN